MHQVQRTVQEEGVTQAYKLHAPPGGQGVRGYNSGTLAPLSRERDVVRGGEVNKAADGEVWVGRA
jgi:hypothetical protein